MSSSSLEESLADLAASQLEGMEKDSNEFGDKMKAQHEAVEDSYARILERIGGRKNKGPEYSDEVKMIANTLVAFPKLVPVVQTVIKNLTTELDKKFDELAAKYQANGDPK